MTKNQAIAFLSDNGQITEVKEIDENFARISFKYKGTSIALYTYEDDPDFLCLRCSFILDDAITNELDIARTLARLQDDLKVAKLSTCLEDEPRVAAMAEQFVPQCDEFTAIFWRSVDLVARAASEACYTLNIAIAAAAAAERFTEQLESALRVSPEKR